MVGWKKEDKKKYKRKDKDNTWLEGQRPQTQKTFSDFNKIWGPANKTKKILLFTMLLIFRIPQ